MPQRKLVITSDLVIPYAEIDWRFSGSGGPGGQHANTSNTRVEALFSIADSPSLNEEQRSLLLQRFGPVLRVVVARERSQLRNREIAIDLLSERIRRAFIKRKRRTPTRPTAGSIERRLEEKRSVSRKKQERARNNDD